MLVEEGALCDKCSAHGEGRFLQVWIDDLRVSWDGDSQRRVCLATLLRLRSYEPGWRESALAVAFELFLVLPAGSRADRPELRLGRADRRLLSGTEPFQPSPSSVLDSYEVLVPR